jgi:hypothetical protein
VDVTNAEMNPANSMTSVKMNKAMPKDAFSTIPCGNGGFRMGRT